MPKILVNKNSKVFVDSDSIGLKISQSINNIPNGISIVDGKLKATKGASGTNGTGTTQNSDGNAIDGPNSLTTKIYTIRCNSTVTRKGTNSDPDSTNEGVNIKDIMSAVLA